MFKIIFYIILALTSFFALVFTAPNKNVTNAISENIHHVTEKVLVRLNSMKYQNKNESFISKKCYEDVLYFLETLEQPILPEQKPTWAHQMMDSYGGLGSGILDINYFWLGDFQQCLRIKVMENNDKEMRFQGQYCLAFVRINKTQEISIKMGTCFPSTCTARDLNRIAKEFVSSLRVTYLSEFCQTSNNYPVDYITVIISALFILIIAFVIAATILDFLPKTLRDLVFQKGLKDSTRANLLLAFSARRNVKGIFQFNSGGEFEAIYGIRAITIFWVVSGHVHLFTSNPLPWKNMYAMSKLYSSYLMQPLLNGELSVDTFFCIGGFLGAIVMIKNLSKATKFDFSSHIIHRLWRVSPAYYFMLLFMCGPYKYLGRGPLFASTHGDTEVCRNLLWKNLFFMQIYFDDEYKCMPHAWYLSVDLIMYIFLLPAIFVPLSKNPAKGKLIFVIFSIISLVLPAILIYGEDLPAHPSLNSIKGARHKYSFVLYEKPWGRMCTVLIGMAFGYLWHTKRKTLKLNSFWLSVIWASAIGLGLIIQFGFLPYMNKQKPVTPAMNLFFGVLYKPLWALIVGWVVYACATGYGGIVNTFLSWKAFVPIGKLSFDIYLVHFSVASIYIAARDDGTYLDVEMLSMMFWVVFSVSVVFGLLLNLTIETPFINLEKLLFSSNQIKLGKETKITYNVKFLQDHNPKKNF